MATPPALAGSGQPLGNLRRRATKAELEHVFRNTPYDHQRHTLDELEADDARLVAQMEAESQGRAREREGHEDE